MNIRTPEDIRAEIVRLHRELGAAYATGNAWSKLQDRLDDLNRELVAAEAAAPILAERARAEQAKADAQAAAEAELLRQARNEQRAAIAVEIDRLLASLGKAHERFAAVDSKSNDRTALRAAFAHWCPALAPEVGAPRVGGHIRAPLVDLLKGVQPESFQKVIP